MLNNILGLFSHDLAIDLGTANVLVFIRNKGIAIREPSVVARHKKTKRMLAIGDEAKKMIGKTPQTIEAFRPLRHGVISDFDATQYMLQEYIKKVHFRPPGTWQSYLPNIPRPKVVISIPSGVTEVERRAVWEAVLDAGARQAYLIEEPMAAAIGADLPIEEARGLMVVDIGGGTTEIAVISLGGIVINRSIRLAGDDMDEAIRFYVRLRHSLIIGLISAEEAKIAIGSAADTTPGVTRPGSPGVNTTPGVSGVLRTLPGVKPSETYFVLRGRSFERGLPKSLKLSSSQVREALAPIVNKIITHITDLVEQTPPELVGDIMEHGIILTGGASQLRGLEKTISEATRMPVLLADDPQTCVVRGAAKVLENPALLEKVKVTGGLQ